ncbi:IS4 family transposase [Pedobacter sp. KBW01]|uniref:IS4 family transposase n=1 Tax=Pedobacter sp. KBW01 TaxID=2153364 RepID=UPI001319DF94|nr:IS4 family transposase [Pedobacter sp. KBW01]
MPIPANISIKQLLELIPEKELAALSESTNVDFQVKTLYGRSMFYLLLYGLATCEKTSLRGLEDVFNSNRFKILFSLDRGQTVRYNSLSDRLATMDLSFFEKAYKMIYSRFSKEFSSKESSSYNIVRVDSTMVAETAGKLAQGMAVGCKKNGKKQVKYTLCLDDLFPSSVQVFTSQSELSEDRTIPKTILKVTDPSPNTVFVFDRGVSSRQAFADIDDRDWNFVTKMKTNARYHLLETRALPENLQTGDATVSSDELIELYDRYNKRLPNKFRLIKGCNGSGIAFFLLSNMLQTPISDIIDIYQKRWDIEVFFRFIKQELNFNHFISTSTNGIKIILYMTLILSMLILIYKKGNQIGYKTAKRRISMELDDMVTIQIVIASGGNPDLVFRGP